MVQFKYHIQGCVIMAVKNLTGKKFGRLTVIERDLSIDSRKAHWVCKCDCGNIKTIRSDSLQSQTKSCGCLQKEKAKITVSKNHSHKESHTHLHNTWLGIKKRCLNPNDKRYSSYGGRGIKVCEEWLASYETFRDWARNNGYKEGLTIERIDVDGNYEPSNCKWIPFNKQANNRRTTIWIEYNGKRQSLMEWSKELGIKYGTLHSRYYREGDRPPHLFREVK